MQNNYLSLNYDQILTQYHEGLLDKLRGFGKEYLKLWVPNDDDKILSILNLIYAVYQSDYFILDIKIKEDINLSKLEKILIKFCDFKIIKKNNIQNIKIDHINEKELVLCTNNYVKFKTNKKILKKNYYKLNKNSNEINKVFLKKKYYKKIKVANYFINENDFIKKQSFDYVAKYKSLKLGISIKNKVIDYVCFTSRNINDEDKFILEKFCQIIEKLPVQEAYEHGIIKLEYSLRPKKINKKILGIIPAYVLKKEFISCKNLILDIRKQYLKDNIFIGKNLFDFKPEDSWLNLGQNEKIKFINKCIKNFEKKNKLKNIIHFEKIQYNIRLTIKFNIDMKSEEKSSILLDLEKFMRENIDKRIEVFYEEIKDANKLRFKNMPENFILKR